MVARQVGAPPKGAVLRDKGAMIRLAESTYARIRQRLEEGAILTIKENSCDVCLRLTSTVLRHSYSHWFLCANHAREIGVLW